MPTFAESLSGEQAAAVVNYVRSHFDNRYGDVITAQDVMQWRTPRDRSP